VRASNARPALVAGGEARTPEGLEKICGIMKGYIRPGEPDAAPATG